MYYLLFFFFLNFHQKYQHASKAISAYLNGLSFVDQKTERQTKRQKEIKNGQARQRNRQIKSL